MITMINQPEILEGAEIPEFELINTHGESCNIKAFKGNKNVVIILFRSLR